MNTTRRIAKKRAAEIVAAALSLPLVLEHAKPSLFALPFGTMRLYVYQTTVRELGVGKRAAKRATWRWANQYRELLRADPLVASGRWAGTR